MLRLCIAEWFMSTYDAYYSKEICIRITHSLLFFFHNDFNNMRWWLYIILDFILSWYINKNPMITWCDVVA